MKTALLLSFVFASAVAQARPYTQNMTCEEANDLVNARGAVVLNYDYHPQAGWLYERFVAHGGYCVTGEEARAAWVKTTNSAQCFIGYTCEQRTND